jgi:hypothetical protein
VPMLGMCWPMLLPKIHVRSILLNTGKPTCWIYVCRAIGSNSAFNTSLCLVLFSLHTLCLLHLIRNNMLKFWILLCNLQYVMILCIAKSGTNCFLEICSYFLKINTFQCISTCQMLFYSKYTVH